MKTMNIIILSTVIAFSGITQSMAQGTDFQVPEITGTLQAQIDKMMDESIQQANRSIEKTAVAQEQAKKSNGKQAS